MKKVIFLITLINITFISVAKSQEKQLYKAMNKLQDNKVEEAMLMVYNFMLKEPLNPLSYYCKYKVQ